MEAIAAKLIAFYWIQSAYNLSDMLSKHWDHPTVYPMTLKLLITRGNITLICKEASQGKEKFIITTRIIEEERKRRIEIRKKMINTSTTYRKISMIFPLVSWCSCVNNPSSS